MKEGLKEKILHWMSVIIFLLIVISGSVCVYPTMQRIYALRRIESENVTLIEMKKREIAEIVENQRRFRTDPDFVEAIARRNRRVFPGELVFVFDD